MAKYGSKTIYKLSRYEQETILLYNNEDKTGSVYTCDPALIRKMDKFMAQYPDVISLKREDEYSKTYNVPKNLFSIRTPSRKEKKEYTDEQKQERNQNLAKARLAKTVNS